MTSCDAPYFDISTIQKINRALTRRFAGWNRSTKQWSSTKVRLDARHGRILLLTLVHLRRSANSSRHYRRHALADMTQAVSVSMSTEAVAKTVKAAVCSRLR